MSDNFIRASNFKASEVKLAGQNTSLAEQGSASRTEAENECVQTLKTDTGNTGQRQQCCSLMYRETVFLLHAVKIQLEFRLLITVKGNKKGFTSIWKAEGGSDMTLVCCFTRLVIKTDIDKAKTLKPFSALFSNTRDGPDAELENHDWGKDTRYTLYQLQTCSKLAFSPGCT